MSNKDYTKKMKKNSIILLSISFCQKEVDLIEVLNLINNTNEIKGFSVLFPDTVNKCNLLIDLLVIAHKESFADNILCGLTSKLNYEYEDIDKESLLNLHEFIVDCLEKPIQKLEDFFVKLNNILNLSCIEKLKEHEIDKWSEQNSDFLSSIKNSEKFKDILLMSSFNIDSNTLQSVIDKYKECTSIKKQINSLAINRAKKLFQDNKLEFDNNKYLYGAICAISEFYLLQESSFRITLGNHPDRSFSYELYYGNTSSVINEIYKRCGGNDLYMSIITVIDKKQVNENNKNISKADSFDIGESTVINNNNMQHKNLIYPHTFTFQLETEMWNTSLELYFYNSTTDIFKILVEELEIQKSIFYATVNNIKQYPSVFSLSFMNDLFKVQYKITLKSNSLQPDPFESMFYLCASELRHFHIN